MQPHPESDRSHNLPQGGNEHLELKNARAEIERFPFEDLRGAYFIS